jgi:hypothetical protein
MPREPTRERFQDAKTRDRGEAECNEEEKRRDEEKERREGEERTRGGGSTKKPKKKKETHPTHDRENRIRLGGVRRSRPAIIFLAKGRRRRRDDAGARR